MGGECGQGVCVADVCALHALPQSGHDVVLMGHIRQHSRPTTATHEHRKKGKRPTHTTSQTVSASPVRCEEAQLSEGLSGCDDYFSTQGNVACDGGT